MDNEELKFVLTVEAVNKLIKELELIRHAVDSNNLTIEDRKELYYHLGIYIDIIKHKKVVIDE